VPAIQALSPEYQHDLARAICDLEPIATPINPAINGIAADLKAVAIEISQRRSFQDRYAADLQAAVDAGADSAGGSGVKVKVSFVPPPEYDPSPVSSAASSPRSQASNLPHSAPQSPGLLSPFSAPPPPASSPPRTPSPTLVAVNSSAIDFIRETLYASLGDALERTPSLRLLLKSDPPRAYFAAVSFAVLDVATTSMMPDGSVVGVLGKVLKLGECPRELRPFMEELATIGQQAKEIEGEDTELAMKLAERGEDMPVPRMERVMMMLEGGVGYENGRQEARDGRRSTEGRAVAFANRINGLSLRISKLKAFRERQGEIFKVLAGVGVV
jgi:hypothetical protein